MKLASLAILALGVLCTAKVKLGLSMVIVTVCLTVGENFLDLDQDKSRVHSKGSLLFFILMMAEMILF